MAPTDPRQLSPLPLPEGITENYVDCTSSCGLTFHILESGVPAPGSSKPLLLFLHGFPELGYSWRHVLPALAQQGYHAVAPDQRGYGRTTGWDAAEFSQTDLGSFTLLQLVTDQVALVHALGYERVKCVVGHDFGALAAALCAFMRPDFFRACVSMSHPFKGGPGLPFDTVARPGKAAGNGVANGYESQSEAGNGDVHKALAELPKPLKHYKWYNSTPHAAKEWDHPEQGMQAFLRGYIHIKSADYGLNVPQPLESWTATELARLPHYYIMPLQLSMPQTVALDMKGEDAEKTKRWLSDEELAVYVGEWKRTGFQGGLNWYRSVTSPTNNVGFKLFAGKKMEVPTTFITGKSDWGNEQEPGVLEGMKKVCTDFRGVRYIEGAGHWPTMEQPKKVVENLTAFLKEL